MEVMGRPTLSGTKVKTLSPAALQYLDTKKSSTKTAYTTCLKRFRAFYPRGLDGFISEIEGELEANRGKPLAERTRPGEATVRDYVKWMGEKGYANKSVRQAVAALQNALKYYSITLSTNFIELPPDRPMKENDKHQWTLDQIRQFAEAAEYLRDKCYILFQVQSGLSIGDILALNYGDIRREYENGTIPLAIENYRMKTNVPIRTFIGHDAVTYLQLYLQSRQNLRNDSPLFTMLGTEERATPAAVNKMLRKYAWRLSFIYEEDMENGYSPARPHSLRAAFRSRLTGKLDSDLIETFMAHDIGQEKSTYMNQPLDELREIYESYEHLLSVYKTSRQDREEQSRKAIPETAMNIIREQGQRIAELEATLTQNEQMREEDVRRTTGLEEKLRQQIQDQDQSNEIAEIKKQMKINKQESDREFQRLAKMLQQIADSQEK